MNDGEGFTRDEIKEEKEKLGEVIMSLAKNICKKVVFAPCIFMKNETQVGLYNANTWRFINSFYKERKEKHYLELEQAIKNNIELSNGQKIKMRLQYRLLWHLIGTYVPDYLVRGGIETSTKMHMNTVTTKRRELFNNSVSEVKLRKVLDNKKLFNERFHDLIHREWIMGNDERLEEFCDRHEIVLVKPIDGLRGIGVHSICFKGLSDSDKKTLLQKLNSENLMIEQMLKQEGVLHEWNPSSVNTLRVHTLLDGDAVIFLEAALRVGSEGNVTDNAATGGIAWQLEQENGRILFGVQRKGKGNIIYSHPDSNIKIAGEKVPRFLEAIEMCKQAHKRVPEVLEIGWDVVISEDYIALIEGNSKGDFFSLDPDGRAWKIMKEYLYKHQIKVGV